MARTIIEIQGLTKRYGEVTAVDKLDLRVEEGEVFGLLGPNGAGKTTTTLMLLGLTEPTAGSAAIEGVDCTRDPIRVKRAVGYLPDNMGFYPDMTGRENLRMTGKMNGLRGEALETRINELLERMGMTEAADRRASTYSKGMKQRLGIADILLKDPDVLILDEPTNGVDLLAPVAPDPADLRPRRHLRQGQAGRLRADRGIGGTAGKGERLLLRRGRAAGRRGAGRDAQKRRRRYARGR